MNKSCPSCSEPMEEGKSTIEAASRLSSLHWYFDRMFNGYLWSRVLFFQGVNKKRKILLMEPDWDKESLYCSDCRLVIIQDCGKWYNEKN